MSSSVTITLKPAADLTPSEIADCYALVAQTGFRFQPGYLESAHLVHNPTMVMAHQAGRLVGIQSYSFYHQQTPFRRQNIPFLYGGIAFQDSTAAGRGIAHQMSVRYMRHVLGPFWPLRSYAFLMRTPNPKLMQLMGAQHQLYLPTNGTLTPALIDFVRDFVRQKRSIQYPIDDCLVVRPPDAERIQTDITAQWPLLYRSSQDAYNQLAFYLQLIGKTDDQYQLLGNYLLVLGRSSRSLLMRSGWTYYRRWLSKR